MLVLLVTLVFHRLSAQSDGEVMIAETLMFTNELAEYTNDTSTRQVLNVVNSLYNTSYDLKDVFAGKGSPGALNQSALELANSLAAISGNPKLQKAVQNMNEFNAAYQNLKADYGGGMDATTSATMDGIAMGVQGLILLDGLFSKKNVELTKGQLATKKYMIYTSKVLQKIHKEYSTLPEQKGYDIEAWQNVAAFEKRLDTYNKATAKQRLLVLKYMTASGIPEFATLQQWTKEIKNDYATHGLGYIVAEVDKLAGYKTDDHLKNAEQSLKGAKSDALLFKINYYYKNGDEAEAAKITEQLAAVAPYDETKKALNSAFEERNYTLAAQLSPVFFAHWMRTMNNLKAMLSTAKKNDIPSITMAGKLIMDDIAIVGKGTVSMVKNGQYANADAYLERAKAMYNDFKLQAKAKNLVATEYNADAGTEDMYFNHAKAEILQQQGKYSEAIQKIDSALLYSSSFVLQSGYTYRIKETKVDLLIQQKQFDKALSECTAIERGFISVSAANNYDAANFKFMKALIFYNMGKHQLALGSLTALKALNPNMPKIYLLEKEAYLALGDKENAVKAEQTIQTLYK